MDSPQSVVSPFKGSAVFPEREKHNAKHLTLNLGCLPREVEVESKEEVDVIGVLDVYIHQARDIHNICIYNKQDVYAKICLTSDPENTVSTQTIDGGGKNPIFNEKLQLNVRTIDSSLKCEIWMLSRVRNYLEDQLLGFALVPLSEVLIKNGNLDREFSLSSTDLFHSPAGFVLLSLSYSGASPEFIVLPSPRNESNELIPNDFDKIEFPDPKIANENHMMLSEYIEMQCANMESQSSESLVSSNTENQLSSEIGGPAVESFSTGSMDSIEHPKHDYPPSMSTTNESPSASKSSNQEPVLPGEENLKAEGEDFGDSESNVSNGVVPVDTLANPILNMNIEPEQKVVQQDIVDMYMKSMQQFTDSLAKMKLPMDIESGPTSSGSSSTDLKLQQASKNAGSRVFYGSRAFF